MNQPLRGTLRLEFARRALGEPRIELESASADAGFRSYWRARRGGQSWIVMDAPPGLEDTAAWLRMRSLLHEGGVRVPAVLAADVANGMLVLEDLGRHTLLDVVNAENADSWFGAAIDMLVRLQAITCPPELGSYDERLLARELKLFETWFLRRHLGLELDVDDRERLRAGHRALIQSAAAQPRVLVHRDFMLRNLMPLADGSLAVLDFQDARRGPLAYDPLCLFKDAFHSWPDARVAQWLSGYREHAAQAGLPVPDARRFRRDIDLIGIQRHFKVLGVFARLRHRDHKPRYLADAGRFVGYLDAVLPRHPELQPLHELMQRTVRPAFERVGSR